jgi:hypothetical protein
MSIHTMLTATSLGASGRFPGSTWVSTHGTEAVTPNISLLGGPEDGQARALSMASRSPIPERPACYTHGSLVMALTRWHATRARPAPNVCGWYVEGASTGGSRVRPPRVTHGRRVSLGPGGRRTCRHQPVTALGRSGDLRSASLWHKAV